MQYLVPHPKCLIGRKFLSNRKTKKCGVRLALTAVEANGVLVRRRSRGLQITIFALSKMRRHKSAYRRRQHNMTRRRRSRAPAPQSTMYWRRKRRIAVPVGRGSSGLRKRRTQIISEKRRRRTSARPNNIRPRTFSRAAPSSVRWGGQRGIDGLEEEERVLVGLLPLQEAYQ